MRLILSCFLVLLPFLGFAQDFEFGRPSRADLEMKTYAADTSAAAVMLNEFGEAYISSDTDQEIAFVYHVRIKILKQQGISWGDFIIPLFRDGSRTDRWYSLEATTFNLSGNSIVETKMENKAFFLEKSNKDYSLAKFSLPNVKVGSVIEVRYKLFTPFIFNFRTWDFQQSIPKVKSVYWIKIPGIYIYNITLKGFLKLSKTESYVEDGCFAIGNNQADCMVGKYTMENIPAFTEEKYMTSKNNFISRIIFELSETRLFDGKVNKMAQEWKDVDDELRQHAGFGVQIKKARNFDDDALKLKVAMETDPFKKANIIYQYINSWYTWDGDFGRYSEDIRKAREARKGNAADINLALVGVLQGFDLDADPVLVSTRDNGLPIEVHPVRSSFNYVVARIKIGDKYYLLDATDPFLPFGMLPVRCLNGKGRVISKTESSWVELKPSDKSKKSYTLSMKISADGNIKGTLTVQSLGYAAVSARKKILNEQIPEYVSGLEKDWEQAKIENFAVENLTDIIKPLIEKMDITFAGLDDSQSGIFYFNPFVLDKFENNPFKAAERLYPVDYGVAQEVTTIVSIELPENYQVDESPANMNLALPAGGGKFLLNASTLGSKVMMTCVFSLNKPVYTSEEYHYLREFYARIVQVHQGVFVFKKK